MYGFRHRDPLQSIQKNEIPNKNFIKLVSDFFIFFIFAQSLNKMSRETKNKRFPFCYNYNAFKLFHTILLVHMIWQVKFYSF